MVDILLNKSKAFGLDCGTMFFQAASLNEKNEVEVKTTRNAFVELDADDDTEEILSQNNWQYVKDNGRYYVIGEDSLRVAKMFPGKVELRRPMKDGVLNKDEEQKMIVMSEMIQASIGKAPSEKSVVCSCVSSPSADDSPDNVFHRRRIEGMIKVLGWTPKIIDEGYAVILAEKPTIKEKDGTESTYSGLGISFGAGRVNCVLSYKKIQIVGMSCARSGDWID